jgi:hypothetical protein
VENRLCERLAEQVERDLRIAGAASQEQQQLAPVRSVEIADLFAGEPETPAR